MKNNNKKYILLHADFAVHVQMTRDALDTSLSQETLIKLMQKL